MDDDQKDAAIIEASALLVTLVFIILSFYGSVYYQLVIYYLQRCTVNQTECRQIAPFLTPFTTNMATLEPLTYVVGLFFMVAASAAAIRLLWARSSWSLAGLRAVEVIFFVAGIVSLAGMFFLRFALDIEHAALTGLILGVIILLLVLARRGKRWRSLEPQSM
jgi:hypothetical protein